MKRAIIRHVRDDLYQAAVVETRKLEIVGDDLWTGPVRSIEERMELEADQAAAASEQDQSVPGSAYLEGAWRVGGKWVNPPDPTTR